MADLAEETLLKVALRHRVGALRLAVEFLLDKPWTVLFGPSGSGKTTVLRAIAGLMEPESGRIVYTQPEIPLERVLMSADDGVFVAAHLRPVRGAAQTAWLFPKMSVRENIRYGAGWSSHPDDERQVVEEVLALFRLATLAARMPKELSGGERQRVSVARAVVAAVTYDGTGRALLLLDEPFSGLDGMLRDGLAVELREWLRRWKIPVLSVSHDVAECFLLGAEVIRMAEGQVIEQGPVEVVLAKERDRILAGLGA